jgi:hypothetical protein
VRGFILLVALLTAVVVGGFMLASEYGGEVVTLRTTDERGIEYSTSLWVVEDEGSQWLRAGSSDSGWYQRLKARPEITMERNGEVRRYQAQSRPDKTARINLLMARDYGLADRLIGIARDESQSVAIRLDRLD